MSADWWTFLVLGLADIALVVAIWGFIIYAVFLVEK